MTSQSSDLRGSDISTKRDLGDDGVELPLTPEQRDGAICLRAPSLWRESSLQGLSWGRAAESRRLREQTQPDNLGCSILSPLYLSFLTHKMETMVVPTIWDDRED